MSDEVKTMQERLYKECYMGHLPDWWWRKLAEFVVAEVKRCKS
jgi:hypothetical protein